MFLCRIYIQTNTCSWESEASAFKKLVISYLCFAFDIYRRSVWCFLLGVRPLFRLEVHLMTLWCINEPLEVDIYHRSNDDRPNYDTTNTTGKCQTGMQEFRMFLYNINWMWFILLLYNIINNLAKKTRDIYFNTVWC